MSTNASNLPDFDKLWNFGDPAGTKKKFKEIVPTAKASGNKDYLLQLLTQIARTRVFNSSKKAERAQPLFVKAFELSQSHHMILESTKRLRTSSKRPSRSAKVKESPRQFDSQSGVSLALIVL